MRYFKAILILFCLVFSSCGKDSGQPEEKERITSLRHLCSPESDSLDLWQKEFSVSPKKWAKEHGAILLEPIPEGLLVQFNRELNKIPEPLFSQLVSLESQIELFIGENMRDHPNGFNEENWQRAMGAGGTLNPLSPAAVVVNRIYDNYTCSSSIVLHEYGHWVEIWLEELGVDWRPEFTDAYPEEFAVLEGLCGSHYQWPHERFAEGFAAYFSCERSRQWMLENMPQTSKTFEELAKTGLPMERLSMQEDRESHERSWSSRLGFRSFLEMDTNF